MGNIGLREGVAVAVALVVVAGFFLFINQPTAVDVPSAGESAPVLGTVGDNTKAADLSATDELIVEDLVEGGGATAVDGSRLSVHYVGFLPDGTQFDSSVERGQPFVFVLGEGQVIEGWEEGLVGMREGGRRALVIPSELAYGARGTANIPPNSTLIFEVLLLEVR